MSDTAPGPDWWIASDGRWYPPELHPDVRSRADAAAPGAAAPGAAADTGWQPDAMRAIDSAAQVAVTDPAIAAPGVPAPMVPAAVVPPQVTAAMPATPPPVGSGPGAELAVTGPFVSPSELFTPPSQLTSPSPSPASSPSATQATGPIAPAPGGVAVTPTNWQYAVPGQSGGAPGPSWTSPQPSAPASSSVAATPWSSLARPGGGRSRRSFDDNPFSHHHRRRMSRQVPTMHKRGRLALPLKVLLLTAVAAVGAGVGYYLTHPSKYRSPDAIAMDFYQQLATHDYQSALSDVVPSEQGQATSMASQADVQSFVSETAHENIQLVNPQAAQGVTDVVTLEGCGQDFSCSNFQPVPTVKQAGKWYVDFEAWQQELDPGVGS